MPICYIGLGSNLNNPPQQIAHALQAIDALPESQRLQTSSLYHTKPVGPQDQPDFVNAVTKISTELTPRALLQQLQAIERQQGRRPSYRWGPRVIDLDILLYGEQTIHEPDLIIPHPRMWERAFVMDPLSELMDPPYSTEHQS